MGDENLGDVSQKNSSKKLLYVIVAVVLVGILVGVYFIFMPGGGSPEDEVVEKLQPIIDSFEADANSIVENSDNAALAANVLKSNITKIEKNGDNFEVSVRFYLDTQTSVANLLVFTYDVDEGKFTNVTSSGILFPLPAEMTFEKFQTIVKRLDGDDSNDGEDGVEVETPSGSCSNSEYSTELDDNGMIVLDDKSSDLLESNIEESGNEALGGLSGLHCLEKLIIDRVDIEDFALLGNLANLEYLSLSGTLVSDISFVSNLNKLKYLDLKGTEIADVSVLAYHPSLTTVDLFYTPIDFNGDVPDYQEGFKQIKFRYSGL